MPISNHPNYMTLTSGTKVWRYLDFDKFESLLKTSSLFFCRADKFSDPFEGSIPKQEFEFRKKILMVHTKDVLKIDDEELVRRNLQSLTTFHRNLKRAVVVNCWHINDSESDAMWRLYLKSNEGVAIQSTKERIDEVMGLTSEEVSLSKVRYLDYDSDIWYHQVDYPHRNYNLITSIIHKRIEFRHEQEFRMFIQIEDAIHNENYWLDKPNEKGRFVQVDLNSLIENIYLPPTIDERSRRKIENLARQMGFEFNYLNSKLSSEPFY